MSEPNMPVPALFVNIEMTMAADRIENQPNTKAARLPVLPEDLRNADAAAYAPEADAAPSEGAVPMVIAPEVPVDIVPASPADVAPADPPVDVVVDLTSDAGRDVPNNAGRKKRPLVLILAAVVAALILAAGLCGWMHFDSYQDAVVLAEGQLYQSAQDTLFLPGLTKLHDPDFSTYLDAGIAMTHEAYDHARALLEPLAEAGYRDADRLLLDIDYEQGRAAYEEGEYSLAIQLLKPLATQRYRDSWELYCEARITLGLNKVKALHSIDSVVNGLLLLSGVIGDGYAGGTDAMDYAHSIIYEHAIHLYEQDNLLDALDYFSQLDDYADAEKYIALCNTYWGTTTAEELWNLRGFANADKLLLTQYYLCEFLLGSWRTSNNSYYFNMEAQTGIYAYYCSYNLPWQYNGDFEIVDGVYRVFHNGSDVSLSEFKITIVSWNQISVYCYKNGSTYTLYRQ